MQVVVIATVRTDDVSDVKLKASGKAQCLTERVGVVEQGKTKLGTVDICRKGRVEQKAITGIFVGKVKAGRSLS